MSVFPRIRLPWVGSVVLLGAAFALSGPARAAVTEEQFDLPVEVIDGYGKRIAQPIRVTVFSDPANPRPAPVLVLGHGRAAEAQDRANFGRGRFTVASRFFVQRGFIVAVPTRIGYGVSGGEDVEDSGRCDDRRYGPPYAAAAQQLLQTLTAVRRRPDAAQDRAVLLGQSFGGAAVLGAAALHPPGVQAVINFAGGGGGNPKTSPGRPCSPQRMERLLASYGQEVRVPSLWLYAENDQYWGPALPHAWFDAYRAAGGRAEFVQFPPQGEDGHSTFARFPQTWQPVVGAWLDRIGFAAPAGGRTAAPPPRSEEPAAHE
ncbi:dienelactone hydrolase family protein [Xylophilus sp.]|uniref:dienelactone hydrolase family protein n=1 Tax=Xylophilus sp. TaxID=2653893 RepID=UPI0013BA3D2C|nr:dienelactone hydrolase [Xylophilus sp.]KAF1043571.1 MAG: hypothetical protein GAK38_03907 [Xylophilus sp.]